jgi:hypothetical protein
MILFINKLTEMNLENDIIENSIFATAPKELQLIIIIFLLILVAGQDIRRRLKQRSLKRSVEND